MRVDIHNKLGAPQIIECTRIVVYDINDNPICYALEYEPAPNQFIYAGTAQDADFNDMLAMLGINRTLVVANYVAPPLDIG